MTNFKTLFMILLFLSASGASAQVYSESVNSRNPHSILGNITFAQGGLGLGADYEYAYSRTHGIGGYARMYQKDDDRGANGIVAIGGFIRPHFNKKSWDLYLSPGLAIISVDGTGTRKDVTTLGASLALGLLYQVSPTIAFGIENMKHYVWFDADYRGLVMDELSLKLRVSF